MASACGADAGGEAADSTSTGETSTTDASDTSDTGETGDTINEDCIGGSFWTGGNLGSPYMQPGGDCIGCHQGFGIVPELVLAGTVYRGEHEVDDCNGISHVWVTITDSTGAVFQVESNVAGNFMIENETIVPPYTASLEFEGRTREMLGEVMSMSCNECHTAEGAMDAPGRILVP